MLYEQLSVSTHMRSALTLSARLHSLVNQKRPPSVFQHPAGQWWLQKEITHGDQFG